MINELIITADIHLRPDKPRCRRDEDWYQTQEKILFFIADRANEKKSPVAIIGDIFGYANPNVPSYLSNLFMEFCIRVKKGVYILAGNHDLPYHSFNNVYQSSFGVFWKLTQLPDSPVHSLSEIGSAAHFNEEIETGANPHVLFLHQLTLPSKKDIPLYIDAVSASQLLQQYKEAQWIFTGDNHHHFHYEQDGRHVINPGCTTRQAADFIDYRPVIYYVNFKEEKIQTIFLPDDSEMVTDEFLRNEESRENRISAFIEGIHAHKNISLSFLDNIERYLETNKIKPETKRMIQRLIEGGK